MFSDFDRLGYVARVGADAGRAWKNAVFLLECRQLEGDAYWLKTLSSLGVAFDHAVFRKNK